MMRGHRLQKPSILEAAPLQDYIVLRVTPALGELEKAALSPDAGSPHPAHGLVRSRRLHVSPTGPSQAPG